MSPLFSATPSAADDEAHDLFLNEIRDAVAAIGAFVLIIGIVAAVFL